MNRKKTLKIILWGFLITIILVACGRSQDDLDAIATQAVEDSFSTKTTNATNRTPTLAHKAAPTETLVPTTPPLIDSIELPECVDDGTSDQKTFEGLITSLAPYLNEMESYRYHTLYQYQVEGEYPEDALSVEVIGAHSGRLPVTVEQPESDDSSFLEGPLLASDIYERSHVKLIDQRTGDRQEVIINNQGFWVQLDGGPGWIEFTEPQMEDILNLPAMFSPQSTVWNIPQKWDIPYGVLVPMAYAQPPLMSNTDQISGQEVTHRCWFYPDVYGLEIAHPGFFTILSDAELHLWTAEDDTQFVRLAITGTHLGECINHGDDIYQHDNPRSMTLWMDLYDVGDSITIEPPDDEQVVLSIPPTSSEPTGEVSAPINELPLPADASVPESPETLPADPREYPFEEPREYLQASNHFFNDLMVKYASQGLHHTPASRHPTYLTGNGLSETAKFYLEEMARRGWQLKERRFQLGMPELSLIFEQGDIVLPVFLAPEVTGGTSITAILPPSTEVLEAARTGWTEYTPGNSGLSDEFLDDIAIDQEGRVWTISMGGVDAFDGIEWSHHEVTLEGMMINPIKADEDGNILVGTSTGLAIFDGQNWTYRDIKEGADVDRIFIDSPEKIWVSLENQNGHGLGFLEGGNFTYFSNEEIGFHGSHMVTSLVRDPEGQVWISTDSGGLFVYDGNDWRAEQNPDCPPNYVGCYDRQMVIDQQGWLWINEPGELRVFNGQEWGSYTSNSGLPYPNIERIAVDQHNRLWATSYYGGLSVLETDGQWLTYTPIPSSGAYNIRAVEVDPQGRIWLATLDGVLAFNPPDPGSTQRREFPTPTQPPPAPTPLPEPGSGWTRYTIQNSKLPSNMIYSIVIDGEDQVWIGTISGLSVFSPDGSQVTYTIANSPLLSGNINALTIDNQDRLWIGTCHGLARLEADGTWKLFPPDQGLYHIEEVPEGVRLIYPCIESLALDNEGILWMGNNPGGGGSAVSVVDEDENWTIYIPENSGLPEDHIYTMAVDEQGQIWIGTMEGVSVLGDDDQWETISMDDLGIAGEYESVTDMVFDDKDRLWIGTTAGLVVKDPDGNLTKYTSGDSDLISNYIQALMIDSEGWVWIGTAGGLSILDTNGTWTNHPSGNSHLPLGGITDLDIDQQGRVWAGTPWGVSVYVP